MRASGRADTARRVGRWRGRRRGVRSYRAVLNGPKLLSYSFQSRSQKRTGSIVEEEFAVADVTSEHDLAGVAGLRPDLEC